MSLATLRHDAPSRVRPFVRMHLHLHGGGVTMDFPPNRPEVLAVPVPFDPPDHGSHTGAERTAREVFR